MEHPLLAHPIPLPSSGPFADEREISKRLAQYRRAHLTEAEALTWFLAQDLGFSHREVARLRGVEQRTSEKTLSRARQKLAPETLS